MFQIFSAWENKELDRSSCPAAELHKSALAASRGSSLDRGASTVNIYNTDIMCFSQKQPGFQPK